VRISKSLTNNVGKLEEISAAAHHLDFFTNTGLSVHYKASQVSDVPNLPRAVYTALRQVLRLHPILFAIPVLSDTEPTYWGRLPSIDLTKVVSFAQRKDETDLDTQGRDSELDSVLENQHNTSFKTGYGTLPVWRLVILEDHGCKHQFMACLIAHHSMSDGTGLQIFHNAFYEALCNPDQASDDEYIVSSQPDDPITLSLEELHELPIPPNPPKPTPSGSNEWTGTPVQLPCKTRYASLSLHPEVMKRFGQTCRKHKVSSAAALPSFAARLLYSNLPDTAQSITCNIPISLRSDLPQKHVEGAIGNFIDAFKVKLLRSDLEQNDSSIWSHARKIQEATRAHFANASPSGQPYTNVAIFKVIPDLTAALKSTLGNARGESFEVSNVGTFAQHRNVDRAGAIWQTGRAIVSRCAYAAGGPLVICIITTHESVVFGFTWQDSAIADDIVESVIDGWRRFLVSPE
jgi:hypothetical protein